MPGVVVGVVPGRDRESTRGKGHKRTDAEGGVEPRKGSRRAAGSGGCDRGESLSRGSRPHPQDRGGSGRQGATWTSAGKTGPPALQEPRKGVVALPQTTITSSAGEPRKTAVMTMISSFSYQDNLDATVRFAFSFSVLEAAPEKISSHLFRSNFCAGCMSSPKTYVFRKRPLRESWVFSKGTHARVSMTQRFLGDSCAKHNPHLVETNLHGKVS